MPFRERVFKALHEKNAIQRHFGRKAFPTLQRLGLHLTGDHFYEPIPNTRLIRKTYVDEPRLDAQIDYSFELAEERLVPMLRSWGGEFWEAATAAGYLERNFYFSGLDSITLYCIIREVRPNKIVEIGQGMSTRVIVAGALANFRDDGNPCTVVSIDPHQRFRTDSMVGINLSFVQQAVQDTSSALFRGLERSDIVFVDSSHIYKFGSDVEYLFERIYPILSNEVIIHIHDIFSPYHYPLEWFVKQRRFWNEQYFLERFLQFNEAFRVLVPVYYLQRQSALLRSACHEICTYPGFKYRGSSFYLSRVADGSGSDSVFPGSSGGT